jgi:hypothetical protein
MQKPIGGLSETIGEGAAKIVESGVGIGAETAQNHVGNYIKGGYRRNHTLIYPEPATNKKHIP